MSIADRVVMGAPPCEPRCHRQLSDGPRFSVLVGE